MKTKILILIICSSLWIACEKTVEPDKQLNIELKSISDSQDIAKESEAVYVYPNPFSDCVSIILREADSAILNINNIDKFQSFHLNGNSFILDFSNERCGAYNFEVVVGNNIYKIIAVKE